MEMKRLTEAYNNMSLTRKMLLVYTIFAAFFLAVSVAAFQVSLDIFEKKLYANSIQELDYYVKNVKESLEGVEERSREIAMDTDIQEVASRLRQTEAGTVAYDQLLTDLRWKFVNENTEESEITLVRYMDGRGSFVESGRSPWDVSDEDMDRLLERIDASRGEAVMYGPTEGCDYLLCGRKILKWTDMSLDDLGTLVLFCDVGQIIARNKAELETDRSALFVYTPEHMIYQDAEELPPLPGKDAGQGYQILKYRGERYFMCYLTSSDMGWTYVNLFPYSDIYGQITTVRNLVFLVLGITFALFLLLVRKIAGIITKPLEALTESVRVVETGNFESAKLMLMDADRRDEVGVLTKEFKMMLDKIDVLMFENYEKQLLLKDTKYKMLQAQINPHFLYNTLNSIHWMIRAKKNEDAGRMIVELGTLLRSSFDENPCATVEEEIVMLSSYIQIQRFRYEGRAEFTVRTSGNLGGYVMPRMTLQPLVENAILYGADVMADLCRIDIAIAEEKEDILFEVKDNGPGIGPKELEKVRNFTVKPKGHGIGIKNIYERLCITYDAFDFTIDSEKGKGTRIRIRVPKQKKKE